MLYLADRTKPLVAYRLWQILRYRKYPEDRLVEELHGLHPARPSAWRAREVIAEYHSGTIARWANNPGVLVEHRTPAPERKCMCGVSACYESLGGDGIAGVVSLSGRLILDRDWLRAERAQVECFGLGKAVTGANREFITRLASEWEVPVVEPAKLGIFALSIGTEIPKVLRPTADQN